MLSNSQPKIKRLNDKVNLSSKTGRMKIVAGSESLEFTKKSLQPQN